MHSLRLSGKVALVTGASKGIGAGIARHLAAEGAAVAVNYASSRSGAEGVVAEITAAGGRAMPVGGSVTEAADIPRMLAETRSAFGPLDILVNNAGIYEPAPVGQITAENFHRQFNINVLGMILCVQEALQHFGPQGGSIVNVSSIVSTLSPAGTPVYNATKSAVDNLTRSFAKDLAARKIRINCVNPGPVETEGVHTQGFIEAFQSYAKVTPLGRIAQPADIAPAVAFLASAEAGWITGETLYVAGGLR